MDTTLKVFDAEAVLKKLPFHFVTYPSLNELNEFIDQYLRSKKKEQKTVEAPPWFSTRAAGTPAAIEAMFLWIEQAKTNHIGWRSGLRLLRVTEDELFNWYAFWLEGKVHPELAKRSNQFESKAMLKRTAGGA